MLGFLKSWENLRFYNDCDHSDYPGAGITFNCKTNLTLSFFNILGPCKICLWLLLTMSATGLMLFQIVNITNVYRSNPVSLLVGTTVDYIALSTAALQVEFQIEAL